MSVERDGVSWISNDLRTLGLLRFDTVLSEAAISFRADWIVSVSDAWYGPLAHRLAKKAGAKLAVDAYDNYEAYMPWNLPLHRAWRKSIAAADVVTAAGPQLAALLDKHRRGKCPTQIVPMAADPMFIPRNRNASRIALGLPEGVPLIGYMGSWAGNRGTDVLLHAFRRVRACRPDARLVLTGRPPAHALGEPGALSLGYLDDDQLPLAVSAVDVACVITADTAFGRFSYPAKLCEAMACQTPVVATATEAVCWMLNGDERSIAPIGDASAIADRILNTLMSKRVTCFELPTWESSARRFESAIACP